MFRRSNVNWLAGNTEVINMIANVGMFLVWLIYAQLFYLSYSRQRHPTILINQVQGYGLKSTCMISNMSMEPVHLECIIVQIARGDTTTSYNVIDQKPDPDYQSVNDLQTLTHQGPLKSSGFTSLGTFDTMIRRALTEDDKMDTISQDGDFEKILTDVDSIEIRVIADYGPESRPVGARRRFIVQQNETGETFIYPEKYSTHQVIGFRARYFIIPKWLGKCMPDRLN